MREPGCSGRLASRNGFVCWVQRVVVSLPRARVSFGGSVVVCVRGSPAGMEVGGTPSGWGVQVAICQQ